MATKPLPKKKKRYKHKAGNLSHLYLVVKQDFSDGDKWELTEFILKRMATVHEGKWTGSSLDTSPRDISFLFKDRKKMFKFSQDKLVKSRIQIDKTELFDVNKNW